MSWLTTIPIIGKVFEKLFDTVDELIEDKDKANEIKADLSKVISNIDMNKFAVQLDSQTKIIVAEAQGESWLQRNWRPGLMVIFGIIIFNNYVLNPWLMAMFHFNVDMDIPQDMWELLKLGVGGYIVGRSVEKGLETWKARDPECK
jgi:hypothetical protein